MSKINMWYNSSVYLVTTTTNARCLLLGQHSNAMDQLQVVDHMHRTAHYRYIDDQATNVFSFQMLQE